MCEYKISTDTGRNVELRIKMTKIQFTIRHEGKRQIIFRTTFYTTSRDENKLKKKLKLIPYGLMGRIKRYLTHFMYIPDKHFQE